ncbi:MAG: hypothetical protein ACKVHL_03065 [Rhodospirillales bacterium]
MDFRIFAVFAGLLCAPALLAEAADNGRDQPAPEIAFLGMREAVVETGIVLHINASDQISYLAALGRILEKTRTGTLSTWKNSKTGQHGTITPTKTMMQNGIPCRTYIKYPRGR